MFRSVTLEMSLKPFRITTPEYIERVCAGVFEQWKPLLKHREDVSILLWAGDGSELLDYAGDLSKSFEWGCYLGTANNPPADENDPPMLNLHAKKRLYTKDPPVMTYEILKTVVRILKREGQKACGCMIRVGATFDIGPEFAVSDFKYKRHPEITSGQKLDSFGFIDATAVLNSDDCPYAAYPSGIPAGTHFGTFLGKQSQRYLGDMGFDYLWLSNGLGFSADPWSNTGKIFDGERFYPEKLAATKKKVLDFWTLFRKECSFPVETRGTNNSVGIDYATDGVPIYDLYRAGLDITPPPNSPWAALNGNYGLELMGHMTRICELPEHPIKFRYYIHDPWWANSPWYDRYNGQPHDIYLPMAVSRIDEKGNAESAGTLNILTVDNSFGDMPDSCVYEPLPHLMKAEKDCADRPAPFVWVYPMREYATADTEQLLSEMYYGDMFICGAINSGFPLNCVVSADIFMKLPLSLFADSVLISPVQPNGAAQERLASFAQRGGRVIFYGTADRLSSIDTGKTVEKADIAADPSSLLLAAERFGYTFRHERKTNAKAPAMTISRNNNAFIFSVHNPDTTTDTLVGFPQGAPILDCGETELCGGLARYRFSRCEHRECRLFVQQDTGVASVKEMPPVSGYYRRVIRISGLKNATVLFYPETYCIKTCGFVNAADVKRADCIDILPDRQTWRLAGTEGHEEHYIAENVSGDYYVCMPFRKPLA